ncbi:peptide MFS transporter [Sphingosinicella sp.]|uniref:peptide MFS transporter n=1 Tax=Sphingosinicella sp. TaxID=1917971 RepID=UPI00261F42E9|nr:peptide MFS transporter [Sphingosinicella sp.]MEA3538525.1 peptide MFS transporter [Pseudomonadota bacterium]
MTISEDRRFLGHPIGLGYLAFTEAWERFSFYGMQALLVLYMTKELLLPGHVENVALFQPFSALYGGIQGQALASAIFGTYAASVYLTPILGGFLADRVLGKRRTVLLGAITMAVGHFLMAFEAAFLFALLCLVLGSGMFKGNIASQVGALYGPGDLRRADAFQIFYLGINAGVIASPLIVGTLGETVGWHWGFGAAGIGMLIGLAIYVAGQKHLPREHFEPRAEGVAAPPKLQKGDWPAVIALLLLIPVLAVAIVPNNQIFNAYLVWGDQQFDLDFMGEKLPTTWLVTLDAVVSVSFLALVALFYRWYGKRWKEPDEITKIIIGSAFSIGGMLCLYMAAETQGPGEKIGLAWPVAFHFVNSIGFAHMLPVSLALFAKLAPKAINATVIGLYYLAFFTANALVGWIGGFYETMQTTEFWLLHAGLAAGAGVVFVAFKLLMGRRLAG